MKDTIYRRFYYEVLMHPDRVAVIDRTKKYTYQELNDLAIAIQRNFPVAKPHVVAIVMRHDVAMIASILAVLRSGAAYMPIEPTFPVERINFMLSEAKADFMLTDRYRPELTGCQQVKVSREIARGTEVPAAENKPQDIAYILYTSGTTGRPKGIQVDNGNVCHYADAFEEEFKIGAGDVMLQHSVCTFDIFVEEVFSTLLNGATLAIPDKATRNDIDRLMKFLEKNGVTIISGFPYLLQEINKKGYLPESVRLLISGGDVLRDSYITNLKDKALIYNTYGPSETTVCATYQRCDNIPPLPDGTYPIGHPVKGTQVVILGRFSEPKRDGELGEICILGEGVSHGYIGDRPEQANFKNLGNGQKMYRSGDMGYRRADGTFAFLHRKDSQVMIWGKRVECNEVENVLCECQEVERAAVRPIVDSEGLFHLVAYIVPSRLQRFSLKTLKTKLARMLTSFMIPEVFVKMKQLPLTANGKVDDRMLKTIPVNI